MSTTRKRLTQAQKSASPKLAKLKSLGLFKGNVRRPSKYGVAQAKKYSDVLSGRAAVVKVPRSVAREYRDVFKTKGDRVVVLRGKDERVRFDKKTRELTSTRREYDLLIRKRYQKKRPEKASDLPPEKKGRYYTIPFKWAKGSVRERFRFSSFKELQAFMSTYDDKWPNWIGYVEIEEINE